MTSLPRGRTGLLAAVAVLLLSCAAPARATGPRDPGQDWLLLDVNQGASRWAAPTRTALLRCDPPRGHATATEACADLDAAGGDIAAVPPRKAPCTMIYRPVTAHAEGRWRGRSVAYTRTFPNACVLHAQTGSVFPPATGANGA
ncbi:SSI family serine proteinase inhibitor [Streptomyces sp. NPDC048182]|uniref:SSI family serine proteinase inhibitor n=1 Tax=Streptomyces sp. NPDC048182 TaxID=3365507 RepID=UPI003713A316